MFINNKLFTCLTTYDIYIIAVMFIYTMIILSNLNNYYNYDNK